MAAVCKPCAAALAMGQWLACAPSRAGAGWDSGPASEIACVCARPCCARASILSLASASKTTTKSFSTPQSVTERWPLHVYQHSSMGAECGNQLSKSQKRDGQRRGFFEPICAEWGGSGVTGRYYRGRYVAKLEPLCNHHALNHGYAFVTSPCVVYFSTAHRQQQALFAQWSLYLPHRRCLPDLHLGALDVQLPG